MVQLSATMEQTHETQLPGVVQLYDMLGFRQVITRYDVLSTLHETGPCTVCSVSMVCMTGQLAAKSLSIMFKCKL